MKRSEMLNLMYKTFSEYQIMEEFDGSILNALDKVLDKQEERGMLPPKIELGDSGFVKVTEILDYTELDYDIIWEPEE